MENRSKKIKVIIFILLILLIFVLVLVYLGYNLNSKQNGNENSSNEESSNENYKNEKSHTLSNGDIVIFKKTITYSCQELGCEEYNFTVLYNNTTIYNSEEDINYYEAIDDNNIVLMTECGIGGIYANCGNIKVIDTNGNIKLNKENAGIIYSYLENEETDSKSLTPYIENNVFYYYTCEIEEENEKNYIITNSIDTTESKLFSKAEKKEAVYFCSTIN